MSAFVPDTFVDKKWLINEISQVVDHSLLGLVRCNPHLALLDCGNVVVRREHLSLDKVKIISGGPSGHEPSFSGFVGKGMLTASVQGGIYSSPTPNLVLKTLKELARRHDKGLLVIISSNTSDRLSFGLAVERIKNIPNVKIRFLQVCDDCNNFDRRGLTGTVLVQKIAGAMAELDYFLFEIHLFCKEILNNMASVLVSLKPAISPYYEISVCARKETKNLEFGAGLHGQPGFCQRPMLTSKDCVWTIIQYITDEEMSVHVNLEPESRIVLVINNLGHSTKVEEMIFLNEVVTQFQEKNIIIERIYIGSFISSIEMCGFSLTILKVFNEDVLKYLDEPTDAPNWKSYTNVVLDPSISVTISTQVPVKETKLKENVGPMISEKTAKIIEQCISFACGAIISCEKQLNIMDAESGDADTGTNIKKPAAMIVDRLVKRQLKIQWPFMLFQEMSKLLEEHFEGLMSCFYSIIFEVAARPFFSMKDSDSITIETWSKVLDSATRVLKKYSGCTPLKTTMLEPLMAAAATLHGYVPAEPEPPAEPTDEFTVASSQSPAEPPEIPIEATHPSLESYHEETSGECTPVILTPLDIAGLVACAAEEAAVKTRRMDAIHPDPGAHAFAVILRAVYEALKVNLVEVEKDPCDE